MTDADDDEAACSGGRPRHWKKDEKRRIVAESLGKARATASNATALIAHL